ncbi:hypothetical protein IWX49DRAFT_634966 [Phyllosticta citricarpa]|uniref:Uncharacterized protein n=1 Tax=Phyllosticta citricarpa TaxID=55181 RepID=A0ABR1MN76_9PEZI
MAAVILRSNLSFAARKSMAPSLSVLQRRASSFSALKVSQDRLWDAIHSTCNMAGAKDGGLRRLSCDDNDKIARDWFASEVKKLGCKYEVDAMGCQWATLPGENNEIPPIGIGSHLDSVQSGGKFDGPLGVLTGLEVAKVLKESGKKTYAPICVINWTNEEGARFPPACMASNVWAGEFDIDAARKCTDTADKKTTIGDELKRIGYAGKKECSYKASPLSAHFEIHIEQGPRLEREGLDVGIVDSVQGMHWFNAGLRGFTRHADTTPMEMRHDALAGAAKIVLEIQRLGRETGGMATVSLFKSQPQNFCNIPSAVDFSFSMQHPDKATLDGMKKHVESFVKKVAADDGLDIAEYDNIWSYDPNSFDPVAVSCIEAAAKDMGYNYKKLISHTAHDSLYTNMHVPTAMVFTPCRDGISHNPLEYASPENCSVGAQTILGGVLRFDDILRKKHSG